VNLNHGERVAEVIPAVAEVLHFNTDFRSGYFANTSIERYCDLSRTSNRHSILIWKQSSFRIGPIFSASSDLGSIRTTFRRILKVCLTGPPVEGRYFTATLTPGKDECIPKPIVSLKPDAEWSDVRAEAASRLDISPASQLTPQAEEIYQWLIKKANI
jgi:hypothetical protein